MTRSLSQTRTNRKSVAKKMPLEAFLIIRCDYNDLARIHHRNHAPSHNGSNSRARSVPVPDAVYRLRHCRTLGCSATACVTVLTLGNPSSTSGSMCS